MPANTWMEPAAQKTPRCSDLSLRPPVKADKSRRRGLLALAGAFQPLDVGQILLSAASTFVLQKVLPGQNADRLIGESGLHPAGPGFLEIHTGYRCEYIDAQRGKADLECDARSGKVCLRQVVQGCTKGT